jgi:hypothetical protein
LESLVWHYDCGMVYRLQMESQASQQGLYVMKINRTIKSILLLLAIAAFATTTRALPEYLRIYASDPFSRPELRTHCSICHVNPAGSGPRNEFGQAFEAAGKKITPELREKFPALFRPAVEAPNQTPGPPVTFVPGSQSEAIVEINGRRYRIDTRQQTVTPLEETQSRPRETTTAAATAQQQAERPDIYEPVDVRAINLPTAISIPKGSLWVDFTHRFPFSEPDDYAGLFGLDSFAFPSFGVTYGITDRIHVGAYRSPTGVGRPIEIFVSGSLLEEKKGHPFNLMGRIALEGRDNFQRNFTTSFELTLARSITRHAQIYFVPTVSLGDRPLLPDPTQNSPGTTAVALGLGLSVNIRPSVALMAEANMRVNESSRYNDIGLGIHRPVVGFGVMKASRSRKHSFTLTFSNGPGTTVAQRSMTRGLFFLDDSIAGLSIGFNLTRRLF